jgi:hypothetical protein
MSGDPRHAFGGGSLLRSADRRVCPLGRGDPGHLTSFYNYTLRNKDIRNLEHVIFLVVGYLFWGQVFPVEHSADRMHPALRMGYPFLAIPVDTFVGVSLNSETHEIFPNYLLLHRTWGPSLVSDLHLGGVIMWVCGDTLMTVAMIPVAVAWLHHEERKSIRVDRELGAMAPQSAIQLVTPSMQCRCPLEIEPGSVHSANWLGLRRFLPDA